MRFNGTKTIKELRSHIKNSPIGKVDRRGAQSGSQRGAQSDRSRGAQSGRRRDLKALSPERCSKRCHWRSYSKQCHRRGCLPHLTMSCAQNHRNQHRTLLGWNSEGETIPCGQHQATHQERRLGSKDTLLFDVSKDTLYSQ
ncbi:hypothetical protein VNO78_23698 [Psophocarpus tetragonolobus]|uniref:Uncharacterized protein n=1 Tax=Psophocarpus tetragonolobus TaxID=3891 RepID=A0AAN9S5A6_PSOTE